MLVGAVNEGPSCIDVLVIDAHRYIVYACGSSINILTSDLRPLHTIHVNDIVKSVSASSGATIAAINGGHIAILAPQPFHQDLALHEYQWTCKCVLTSEVNPRVVAWHPTAPRFLVGGSAIELWVSETNAETGRSFPAAANAPYVVAWRCSTPNPVHFLSFSPDGRLFASAGDCDRMVRVWFPRDPDFASLFEDPIQMDFVYLPHPRAITWFCWRKPAKNDQRHAHFATSRKTYAGCSSFLKNVLLTSCKDDIGRLWSESLQHEAFFFYTTGEINLTEYSTNIHEASALVLHWINPQELHDSANEAADEHVTKDIEPSPTTQPALHESDALASVPSTADTTPLPVQPPSRGNTMKKIMSDAKIPAKFIHDRFLRKMIPSNLSKKDALLEVPDPMPSRSLHAPTAASHLSSKDRLDPRPLNVQKRKADEYSMRDMIFAILHDGSLVFWKAPGLNEQPRHISRITLTARAVTVISREDAVTLLPDLFVFPDLGQFMYRSTLGLPQASMSPFPFLHEIHKPLPVSILCHHSDGTIAKWVANFAQRSELSLLLTMESISRASGHCFPVTAIHPHPLLPFLATVGQGDSHGHHNAEIVIWKVGSVSALTTEPQNSLHAVARLTSKDPDAFISFSWVRTLHHCIFLTNFDANHVRVYELHLDTANPERKSLGQTPSDSFSLDCLGLLQTLSKPETRLAATLLRQHPVHARIDSIHVLADSSTSNLVSCWAVAVSFATSTVTIWRVVVSVHAKAYSMLSQAFLCNHSLHLDPERQALREIRTPHAALGPNIFSPNHEDCSLMFLGVCQDHIIRCWVLQVTSCGTEDSAPQSEPQARSASPMDQIISLSSSKYNVQPGGSQDDFRTANDSQSEAYAQLLLTSSHCKFTRNEQLDISFDAPAYALCELVCLSVASSGRFAVVVRDKKTVASHHGQAPLAHVSQGPTSSRSKLADTPTEAPKSASRVFVFERESSSSHFLLEETIEYPDLVTCVDWLSVNNHRALLAVNTSSSLQILSHTRTRLGSWIPIVKTTLQGMRSSLISWAHDGMVVQAVDNRLHVFSKWADHHEADSFRSLPTAPKDSNMEHVFALSELLHGSLPFYHPKQVLGLLQAGKFDLVDRIFYYLWTVLVAEYNPSEEFSETTKFSSAASMLAYKLSRYSLIQEFLDCSRGAADSAQMHKANSKLNMAFVASAAPPLSGDVQKLDETQSALLSEKLFGVQLPDLSNVEQMHLLALLQSFADIKAHRGSLDANGVRYFILAKLFFYLRRSLPPQFRPQGLHSIEFSWAFHSESQDVLLSICLGANDVGSPDNIEWDSLTALGAGFWLKSLEQLKKYVEKVAKYRFQLTQDPLKCAIFYLALRRKNILWGLFKTRSDNRMSGFFGNDFTEQRWKEAAHKNAYALLGKQKFEEAAAFFLLGDSVEDCTHVCVQQLKDLQLALVIARIYEGDNGVVYNKLVREHVISASIKSNDAPLASIGYWTLKDYSQAFDSLKHGSFRKERGFTGSLQTAESSSPMMLNLCQFVQGHSLVKAHAHSHGILAITYHKAIYEYIQLGLPVLALDTLLLLKEELQKAQSEQLLELQARHADLLAAASKTSQSSAKKSQADLINSGTFSFDAFDDGYGQFEEDPQSEAAPEQSVAVVALEDLTPLPLSIEDDMELLHGIEWGLCTQIVCESLRLSNKFGEWSPIRARVKSDWKAILAMCKFKGLDQNSLMSEVGLDHQTKLYCRLHNLTHSEGALTHNDPEMRIELLSMFVTYVNEFVRAETLGALTIADFPKPISYYRCKKVVRHTFEYFHQLQAEVQRKNESPLTSLIVCEVLFACYVATFIVAWSRKEWDSVLRILSNSLNKEVVARVLLSNIGIRSSYVNKSSDSVAKRTSLVSNAGNESRVSADRLQKAPSVGSTPQNLYFYFLEEQSTKSYLKVDELADADFDGMPEPEPDFSETPKEPISPPPTPTATAGTPTSPTPAGSTGLPAPSTSVAPDATQPAVDEVAEQKFCWTLLELVAFQFVCNELRDARDTLNMETDEINRLSPMIFGVFTALEVRINKLERRLATLQPPPKFLETAQVDLRYPSQSLFKIRGLLDIAANPFKTVGMRRLWHLLVNTSSVQDTIEYFVFHHNRTAPVDDGAGTRMAEEVTSPAWTTAFKMQGDIHSICVCRTNPSNFALGTSKGILELKPRIVSRAGVRSGDGEQLVPFLNHTSAPTTRLEAHPSMPFYVSGGIDGAVSLWQFEQEQFNCSYGSAAHSRIGRISFDSYGNKFAVLERKGDIGLWRFGDHDVGRPFLKFKAHNKADGLSFLTSTSFLATGGTSSENRNVRLWDTLLPPSSSMLKEFIVNDGGNKTLMYVPDSGLLVCGGRRGELATIDLRQRTIVRSWHGHSASIKAMSMSSDGKFYATAAGDGTVSLWSLSNHKLLQTLHCAHRAVFPPVDIITDLLLTSTMVMITTSDGCVKTLPVPTF